MRIPERAPTLHEALADQELTKAILSSAGQPEYIAAARRIEIDYRHWHRVRYIAKAEGLRPEILWAMVKMSRTPSYRSLPLHGEGGEAIKFTIPGLLQQELMHIDQQLAGRRSAAYPAALGGTP